MGASAILRAALRPILNLSDVATAATARTNLAVPGLASNNSFSGVTTFSVASGVPTVMNRGDSGQIKTQFQDAGAAVGNMGASAGFPFIWYNGALSISMSWNGATNFVINSKALLGHAGSYGSGQVTLSTSAPSGGADGDIWLQYV